MSICMDCINYKAANIGLDNRSKILNISGHIRRARLSTGKSPEKECLHIYTN